MLVDLGKAVRFTKTSQRDGRKPADFLNIDDTHFDMKPINTKKHWANAQEYDDKGAATIDNHVQMDTLGREVTGSGDRTDIKASRMAVEQASTWDEVLRLDDKFIIAHLDWAR